MKKFWKKTEGFTLVELIVVIAILGILAGIGTVGYSGYVKKANMAADQALIGEIKQALTLAYYSNPGEVEGVVALSLDAAPDCGGNVSLEEALTKAFGEGWQNREDLRLKSDEWNSIFRNSGFYGDSNGLTDLVTTVDKLTGALSGALDFIEGGEGFNAYMEELGVADDDNDAKANAAVFYVADKTSQLTPAQMNQAIAAMQGETEPEKALEAMNKTFHSDLSSAAALYALAEGYARYYDEKNENPAEGTRTPRQMLEEATNTISQQANNGGISDAIGAYTILFNAFGEMIGDTNSLISEYSNDRMSTDFDAYADVLKTVSTARDAIIDQQPLTTDNYFSSDKVTNLLNKYAEGGVFIYLMVQGDGIEVSDSISKE